MSSGETEKCENVTQNKEEDDEGPSTPKKRKVTSDNEDKLENRLGGILCCAVCLDLPQAAVYQCSNGHLMCAPCFMHLLADARLRDESASCPNCRVDISKTTACRNLAVEKTVSELPLECKFCTKSFPRHSLQHHEENTCDDRLTGCEFAILGCGWRGPWLEAGAHGAECSQPRRAARDLLPALRDRETARDNDLAVYAQLLDLLSYEKLTVNDLQLKPYRTEEFVHKLYYETNRFSAFGQQWVVKAFITHNQRDPTHSSHREITYQLLLKSKPPAGGVSVWWVWVRGPWGEAGVAPRPARHTFREDAAPEPAPLPLLHPAADTDRLLSNKPIHFRLLMFLSPK